MTATDTRAVGVDWSSGVWLAVVLNDGSFADVTTHEHIEDVWDVYEHVSTILIDIPIGLISDATSRTDDQNITRTCDSLARDAIGPRSSSVFPPPAREAAQEAAANKPHSTVSETNRQIIGKGLTIQAYHISEGIAQVDTFLREHADAQETLLESHPENSVRVSAV